MNFNPRSHANLSRVFATTAAALGILALAACGQTGHSAAAGSQAKPAAQVQQHKGLAQPKGANDSNVTEPIETDEPTAVPTADATDTPTAAPSDDPSTPTEDPSATKCPSDVFKVSQYIYNGPRQDGHAGKIIDRLTFTNTSENVCWIAGFPGFTSIDDNGQPTGADAAQPASDHPETVWLEPDSKAYSLVKWDPVSEWPEQQCRAGDATGMRVGIPGTTTTKYLAYPHQVCTNVAANTPWISSVHRVLG